jgi:3-hydroxybutyryl-CoA dehydrogenase
MNILATGETSRIEELKQKFSSDSVLTVMTKSELKTAKLQDFDFIFDLNFDDNPDFTPYTSFTGKALFVSAVKIQLAAFAPLSQTTVIGINALPTFLQRPLTEVSIRDEQDANQLHQCMEQLGWNYKRVDDRVGMVTPRLVYMIINEAYYTVQEGTASKADIDLGMKLGTNYPMGPFEWCEKTGIRNVYEVLSAVYSDTRDERYKICPLLKTEYLKSITIASAM